MPSPQKKLGPKGKNSSQTPLLDDQQVEQDDLHADSTTPAQSTQESDNRYAGNPDETTNKKRKKKSSKKNVEIQLPPNTQELDPIVNAETARVCSPTPQKTEDHTIVEVGNIQEENNETPTETTPLVRKSAISPTAFTNCLKNTGDFFNKAPYANMPDIKRWQTIISYFITIQAVHPAEWFFNYFLALSTLKGISELLPMVSDTPLLILQILSVIPIVLGNFPADVLTVSPTDDAVYLIKKISGNGNGDKTVFSSILQKFAFWVLFPSICAISIPGFAALASADTVAADKLNADDGTSILDGFSKYYFMVVGVTYYMLFLAPKMAKHTKALIDTLSCKGAFSKKSDAYANRALQALDETFRLSVGIKDIVIVTMFRVAVAFDVFKELVMVTDNKQFNFGEYNDLVMYLILGSVFLGTLMQRFLPRLDAMSNTVDNPFTYTTVSKLLCDFFRPLAILNAVIPNAALAASLYFLKLNDNSGLDIRIVAAIGSGLALLDLHGSYAELLNTRKKATLVAKDNDTPFKQLCDLKKQKHSGKIMAINLLARAAKGGVPLALFLKVLLTDTSKELIGHELAPDLLTVALVWLAIAWVNSKIDYYIYKENLAENIPELLVKLDLTRDNKDTPVPRTPAVRQVATYFTPNEAFSDAVLERQLEKERTMNTPLRAKEGGCCTKLTNCFGGLFSRKSSANDNDNQTLLLSSLNSDNQEENDGADRDAFANVSQC